VLVQFVEHPLHPGPVDERHLKRAGFRAATRPGGAVRPGPARVDAVQQLEQIIGGQGNGYPRQRRPVVGVLQDIRDLGEQQPGGPVDRAAAAGERLV